MGWWGNGVVDGDTPWDILSELKEHLGFADSSDLPEDEIKKIYLSNRELLRAANVDELIVVAQEYDDDDRFAITSLTMLYLEHDLTIPAGLKQHALDAVSNELEHADDWNETEERIRLLNQFKTAVEANNRNGLETCGLFWSMTYGPREFFD